MVDREGTDCKRFHVTGGIVDVSHPVTKKVEVSSGMGSGALTYQHGCAHPDGAYLRIRAFKAAEIAAKAAAEAAAKAAKEAPTVPTPPTSASTMIPAFRQQSQP